MSCEQDFLPLRVNSLPLATIYEVKIPLRKWKKSLLQRNPAQMTWHIVFQLLHKNCYRYCKSLAATILMQQLKNNV
jgi:hypothetical protein